MGPIVTDQTPPKGPLDRLALACAADMDRVADLIRTRMASRNAPRIPEITAHLVDAGGKRVRPMLTVAAARLCGYGADGGDDHIKLAATVEFIHTATLLHDDVVDESQQRRGRPTANLLWDNQSSVLVGDYLFARSFQLMVQTGSLRVLDILSGAAATIAEGEVLQLTAARNVATDEATYLQVVRGKTAALFEAAAQVGGVVARAPEVQVEALAAYGDALGISFQMVDDWLDYGGAGDGIGKDLGDDFREGKLTLPVIRAIARGDDAERAFWKDAMERGRGDFAQAQAIIARHGTLEETRREALTWRDRAVAALDHLPRHPLRDMLSDLAHYVVARAS
ncbi:polyprenyl synthetase family protein [Jannaschia sp. LMIT008]|uniref:polyprenyl synthetase family protein n=1 Tax=Jannaschia maritima TaxID=3032585 RepID=UPI0035AC1F77